MEKKILKKWVAIEQYRTMAAKLMEDYTPFSFDIDEGGLIFEATEGEVSELREYLRRCGFDRNCIVEYTAGQPTADDLAQRAENYLYDMWFDANGNFKPGCDEHLTATMDFAKGVFGRKRSLEIYSTAVRRLLNDTRVTDYLGYLDRSGVPPKGGILI